MNWTDAPITKETRLRVSDPEALKRLLFAAWLYEQGRITEWPDGRPA